MSMDDAGRKGAAMEQRIAHALTALGYAVQTNLVLEGRSGAKHEVDVWAEKADELANHRVIVECKAWEQPIEKDVVSKLDYVMRDLGVHAGIIAGLGGFRSGAEAAAKQLGIELWGPAELARRLGALEVAALHDAPAVRSERGFAFQFDLGHARAQVDRDLRGRFGAGKESLVWMAPIWVPAAYFQIAITRNEGRVRVRSRTHRMVNAYNLLDETWLESSPGPLHPVDVDLGEQAIQPMIKPAAVEKRMMSLHKKWESVTTDAARARHADALATLGIEVPGTITIENSAVLYRPYFAAIVQRRETERVIAVSGQHGAISEPMSRVLSANAHWLRASLAP
jgi:hypothetical protein